MNDCKKYIWQWAMMNSTEGSVKDLGYRALFTPEEQDEIGRYVTGKSTDGKNNDEKTDSVEIAYNMAGLMKGYSRFIMPSLNAAFYRGKTVFITPYNATGRWSYGDRHGPVVVAADAPASTDLKNRIERSGMKLKNNISICTADITDSTSVQKLIDDTASDLPVYFSLGLLPLTVMPEHTAKILTAVSASLTPEDNLAFGFISKPGRKRPLNAPVYTRAQMTALLSERGFNVYEDSVYKTDDGSEITFFLAVKKITAQL